MNNLSNAQNAGWPLITHSAMSPINDSDAKFDHELQKDSDRSNKKQKTSHPNTNIDNPLCNLPVEILTAISELIDFRSQARLRLIAQVFNNVYFSTTKADLVPLSSKDTLRTLTWYINIREMSLGAYLVGEDQVLHDALAIIQSKHNNVETLDLQGEQIKKSHITQLVPLPNLKHFRLVNPDEENILFPHLTMTLQGLQSLIIINQSVPNIADEDLKQVGQLTKLEHLEIYKGNFTDSGLAYMGQLVALRVLRLTTKHPLSDGSISSLAGLRNLQSLALKSTKMHSAFTNECVEHMGGWHSLTELNINRFLIDNVGLEQLAVHLPLITSLSLNHSQVTNDGLRILATLPNLTKLDMESCCLISDEGLPHLSTMSKLRSLNLSHNDEISCKIASLIALTQLENLQLKSCINLSSNGLQAIGRIQSLTDLDLSGSISIRPRALAHLATLTNLRFLSINNMAPNSRPLFQQASQQYLGHIVGLKVSL